MKKNKNNEWNEYEHDEKDKHLKRDTDFFKIKLRQPKTKDSMLEWSRGFAYETSCPALNSIEKCKGF